VGFPGDGKEFNVSKEPAYVQKYVNSGNTLVQGE
jgi:hypothetical protein